MSSLEVDAAALPRNGSSPHPAVARTAAVDELKASLKELVRTLLRASVGIALEKVEGLAGSLDAMAASGGLVMGGVLGGVRAGLSGGNPIWGAIKGAVGALSPAVRVGLVLALVLALVLLPVTVVLLLLALIVLIVVAAAKAGS
ncbi:hypothetical protein [Pseudonocardia xishanensis]|uniref:Superfamily III holin-X n=1 Tax=Pseudonocardia xishanensis TaxID=630995 RepID=A0ABP8RSD0_9PSEU